MGAQIMDYTLIKRRQLQGPFWINLLSAIPFDIIAERGFGVQNQLLGLFKLPRLLRLGQFLRAFAIECFPHSQ
jgi:hypothetical protein